MRILAVLLGMVLLGGCSFDEVNRREAGPAETTTTTAVQTTTTTTTTTTVAQTTTNTTTTTKPETTTTGVPRYDEVHNRGELEADYRQNLNLLYTKRMEVGGTYRFSESMSCTLKELVKQPDPEGEGVLVSARLIINSREAKTLIHSDNCGWNYMMVRADDEDVGIQLWESRSCLFLDSSSPEKSHRREDITVNLEQGETEILVPVAWYEEKYFTQKWNAVAPLARKHELDNSEALEVLSVIRLPQAYALIDINTEVHLLDLTELMEE